MRQNRYVLTFLAKLPDCRYEENARRAYRGNRPAIRRRHSRSKGGICLRLDATQDKVGGLSDHLSLLSNVYSGYCACELGGDGYGELTSGATRRVRYGRESRSAALSMTSLSMARPFFSLLCLEKWSLCAMNRLPRARSCPAASMSGRSLVVAMPESPISAPQDKKNAAEGTGTRSR